MRISNKNGNIGRRLAKTYYRALSPRDAACTMYIARLCHRNIVCLSVRPPVSDADSGTVVNGHCTNTGITGN